MAPKTYIAGRGTNDETKTSSSPTVTTPLSPSASSGRAAASTSSAGSPSRADHARVARGRAADRRQVGDRALVAHGGGDLAPPGAGSIGSTKMPTLPPQGSPTSKASSSA